MRSIALVVALVLTFPLLALEKKKVLIIMSAADTVKLTHGKTLKTGYFLRELTDPLDSMLQAGFDVEFASPAGKVPVVDEYSKKIFWYTFPNPAPFRSAKRLARSLELLAARTAQPGDLNAPLKLEELKPADLEKYSGVFIPGGHAPVANLVNSEALGNVLSYFHEKRKPIAAVCHGPVALLSALKKTDKGESWIFKGYHMSVATTLEEEAMESLGGLAPLNGEQLVFDNHGVEEHYVDEALDHHGALIRSNPIPSAPQVTQDRELITGQNPASAELMGNVFVNAVRVQAEGAFAKLTAKSAAELAEIFAAADTSAEALKLPSGDAAGLPLLVNEAERTDSKIVNLLVPSHYTVNGFANLFWSGKIVTLEEGGKEGSLVNKLFGFTLGLGRFEAIKAKVGVGRLTEALNVAKGTKLPSVFPNQEIIVDGKPSILLDYSASGIPLMDQIVDEIRPIWTDKYQGLYLGRANTLDKRFWCYFALKFPQ